MHTLLPFVLTTCLLSTDAACAAEIRVAAASNFREALIELTQRYEAAGDVQVSLSFGSSGKHFSQIVNGAPFDAFFSADAERPALLEERRQAVAGSRFTYARGRLALWSAGAVQVDESGAVLNSGGFRHLAIANPRLAPYGRAAQETLQALGSWDNVRDRLVLGENVGQAFQFVYTGNAELGLVAWSQLVSGEYAEKGYYWLVPDSLHSPIEQQAILISNVRAARDFMDFVQSEQARAIVRSHGYETP